MRYSLRCFIEKSALIDEFILIDLLHSLVFIFVHGRVFSCLFVPFHLFHRLFDKHGRASFHRLLLNVREVALQVGLQVVDVVCMSLLESLNSRSNASEDGLEDHSVDNFGAHERPERQLEPNHEEELECVVEGNDLQDPAHVHVGDSQCAVAHPVGQPRLVVLHVRVRLERLDALEGRVDGANQDADLVGETAGHRLEDQVAQEDKGLQRGRNARPSLDLTN